MKQCKYEECKKELPTDIHAQKTYCPNTKCAYKQNQLDAKRKRAEEKKNKKVIMVRCWNDYCNEEIQKHHRQKYCSKECRNAQNQRDHKERLLAEAGEYDESKKQALIQNGSKKKLVIPAEFLGKQGQHKQPRKVGIKHFSAKWLEKLWNNRVVA